MSAASWCRAWLLVCCVGLSTSALADSALSLFQVFDGKVNFTGTQVTLRSASNLQEPCSVYPASTLRRASLTLPSGATVLSAQLYWAGSGTLDDSIVFEGQAVSAARSYAVQRPNNMDYFSAARDVTEIVKAKGSGSYSFAGLSVANGDPWCASKAVVGGYALMVVYARASEPDRVLNLYEGFRALQNSSLSITTSNFRNRFSLFPVTEHLRAGYIAWEGDLTNALLEGVTLRSSAWSSSANPLLDAINPAGNLFNSISNINHDLASYGVDFDAYDSTVTYWLSLPKTVTSTIESGPDLVLVNAYALVVPTEVVSDMGITLTRSAGLQVGSSAHYTATVTNHGPVTEPGPLTVSIAPSNGLRYSAASGSGWSCVSRGTRDGLCTYRGALAPGAAAPALLVTMLVERAGDQTLRVSVEGTNPDDEQDNNTASDTARAITPPPVEVQPSTSYVFTRSACVVGALVGSNSCPLYAGPYVAGTQQTIHVTAIDTSGKARAVASRATSVEFRFALSCYAPETSAGVRPQFAGISLPLCSEQAQKAASDSAWSAPVSLNFAANTPSSAASFSYADIGQVRLDLKQGSYSPPTQAFVARPVQIVFKRIHRDGIDDPEQAGGDAPTAPAFGMAGAAFTLQVGALVYHPAGNTWAPNFGRESSGKPALTVIGSMLGEVDGEAPGLRWAAPDWRWDGGVASREAIWPEVGSARLDVQVGAGASGDYHGVSGVAGSSRTVGRFYPAYFKTELTGNFDCLAHWPCEQVALGAAFSSQPFAVRVLAFNALDQELRNYRGAWVGELRFSGLDAHGPLTAQGVARLIESDSWSGQLRGQRSLALARPYLSSAPHALDWSVPTQLALRVTARESVLGLAQPVTISSAQTTARDASREGALLIVNGRLKIGNGYGQGALPTPQSLQPEYWNGSQWLAQRTYAELLPLDAAHAQFVCHGPLLVGTGCAATVAPLAGQSIRLDAGTPGVFWLAAPGTPAAGASVDVSLQHASRPWLPSTIGRVVYDKARGPLIYLREVY